MTLVLIKNTSMQVEYRSHSGELNKKDFVDNNKNIKNNNELKIVFFHFQNV